MKWYDAKGDAAARLRQRKHAMLRRFQIPSDALPGSLALTHRRCGKPTCRCAKGEEHPGWAATSLVHAKDPVQRIPTEWFHHIPPLLAQAPHFTLALPP